MIFRLRLLSILGVILVSGCNFTLAADITPPPGYKPSTEEAFAPSITSGPIFPLLSPDPENGAAIYKEKCAPCHGNSGLGNGPQSMQLPNSVPAIGSSQLARKASPAEWYAIVTNGNLERFMPPFDSLSDRQRWDVVSYVWGLSNSPESIEQGKNLFQDNCANCHGSGGKGDGPDGGALIPDLTSQKIMAGKSDEELYQSITNGIEPEMPSFSDQLLENERWSIVSFIRSLSFTSGPSIAVDLANTPSEAENSPNQTDSSTFALEAAQGVGRISGQVVNGTTGTIPVGLQVHLHGFDHTTITVTGTVPLNEDGTYAFEGIEMPEGRVFLTSVDFQNVTYASEAVTVEGDRSQIDLPLQVYDSTPDSSVLKVDRLHYFFEPVNDQSIRVVELYIISNPSGETLVAPGENLPVLEFQIPTGATNLQFQDGEIGGRFILTDKGFGDTLPIRPGIGGYQLLYSYELPIKRSIEFVKLITMPVNAIVILVPEQGISISGETIQDGGVRDVQGISYKLYNGTGITPGNEFRMTISRSTSVFSTSNNTNLMIGISVLGLVLIVSGIWLFRRSRVKGPTTIAGEKQLTSQIPFDNREAVMDAILALDDLFQEGKLPEEAYLIRRNELKNQLKEMIDSQD